MREAGNDRNAAASKWSGLPLALLALVLSAGATAWAGGAVLNDSVDTAAIVDGTVETSDVASGAVNDLRLAPASVRGGQLAFGAITRSRMAPDGVTGDDFQPNSITSQDINDGLFPFLTRVFSENDLEPPFESVTPQYSTIISEVAPTSGAYLVLGLVSLLNDTGDDDSVYCRVKAGSKVIAGDRGDLTHHGLRLNDVGDPLPPVGRPHHNLGDAFVLQAVASIAGGISVRLQCRQTGGPDEDIGHFAEQITLIPVSRGD